MDKSEIQNKEYRFLKGKHHAILKWATGMGKSKMAIDLVNDATFSFSEAHKAKVLLVVAERSHKANWQEEFGKWNLALDRIDITMICYASLHKVRDMTFDVLVLDEAHHSFTEKRMDVLKSLKANYIYLLSATLSRQKISAIEEIYNKFFVSTVTLKTAVDSKALPEPKVNVVELTLDDTKVDQEIRIGKGNNPVIVNWEQRFPYLNHNALKANAIIQCTQRQKYQYYTDTMDYWKKRFEYSQSAFHKNLWVSTGSLRKRFMGELKQKAVEHLLKTLSHKRYICFCASVAQAESLNKKHTISSKRNMRLNQAIIDKFNNKKINSLFAVGMATEGLNLKDIQVGVIVQLDGKERLFVQKAGRAMRAEYPVVWVFCYKDTQDVRYFRNVTENVEEKYIRKLTYNDFINQTR